MQGAQGLEASWDSVSLSLCPSTGGCLEFCVSFSLCPSPAVPSGTGSDDCSH